MRLGSLDNPPERLFVRARAGQQDLAWSSEERNEVGFTYKGLVGNQGLRFRVVGNKGR